MTAAEMLKVILLNIGLLFFFSLKIVFMYLSERKREREQTGEQEKKREYQLLCCAGSQRGAQFQNPRPKKEDILYI